MASTSIKELNESTDDPDNRMAIWSLSAGFERRVLQSLDDYHPIEPALAIG